MIKHIYTLLLIIQVILSAQAVKDTPVMSRFGGGKLNTNIAFGMGDPFNGNYGLSGPRGLSANMINPAQLVFIEKNSFSIELQPLITNSLLGISGNSVLSDEMISEVIDDQIDKNKAFSFSSTGVKDYTQLSGFTFSAGRKFSGLALAIPLGEKSVLSASYSVPLTLGFDMALTGLTSNIKTTKVVGNNTADIDISLLAALFSEIQINMEQVSLSFASELWRNGNSYLSGGITYERYYVSNKLKLNFNIDGVLTINNGSEYFFNDNEDPNLNPENETNSLFWQADADYKDNQSGLEAGLIFKSEDFLPFASFSLSASIKPMFFLADPNAVSKAFQPKFITGRFTGTGQESFDILIDSLDLTKPNLTVPSGNEFTDTVKFSIPSSITFGMDFNTAGHTFSLNITKYWNELSYQFGKYKVGKVPSAGISFGADFKFPEKLEGWSYALLPLRILYLDIDGLLLQLFSEETGYHNPYFGAGGSFIIGGNPIIEGISDKETIKSLKDILNLPLVESIALYKRYNLGSNIKIGVTIAGIPEIAFKFSAGYEF